MEDRAVGDEPHAGQGQLLPRDVAVRLAERDDEPVLGVDLVGAAHELQVEVDRAAGLRRDRLEQRAELLLRRSRACFPGAQRRVPTSRHSTGWRL